MNNENNKMQVDIENLFMQNVNDLSAIKELYSKLKEMEEKISQIKYIDSTLAKKLKNEYEKLKKIILDENVQAKLKNDIETLDIKLSNDIETLDIKLSNDIETLDTKLSNDIETLDTKLSNDIETINVNLDTIETEKASKIYVDNKIGNMGNTKTFKGSCLYSSLPLTAGVDDYWFVTDRNTNYCWNGTTWIDIGNNLNIGNDTITYEKLSHNIKDVIDYSIKGKEGVNKVNLERCEVGKYISDTTGNLGVNEKYTATHFIKVSEGIPNFINGTSDQNYAFYDENKIFLSGGKVPFREVLTTPANAKYIRFTFLNSQSSWVMFTHTTEMVTYEPYKIVFDFDEKSISLSKIQDMSELQVRIKDTLTRIAWKYDNKNDIWFDFDKVGINGLYQISDMWLVPNTNKYPSSDFTKTPNIFFTKSSDWIGPYSVKAKNNILNENGQGYTGGWHGYNGDQTGSATARNISYKLYLDNNIINENGVYSCNELKIVVINRIQAGNTKLKDGNGREVIEEVVTYVITKGKVEVSVKIKALEDINIYKYMGLQTCNRPTWDDKMFFFDDSVNKKELSVYNLKVESGTKANGSKLSSFLMNKDNDYIYAWVDNTKGLGMRDKIDDWVKLAYCENYGKSYMNLIFGNTGLDMVQDEVITWNGGYRFYRE